MADTKVSLMTGATALTGAELFPIIQGGANKAATAIQVVSALATQLGIVYATGLTTNNTGDNRVALGTYITAGGTIVLPAGDIRIQPLATGYTYTAPANTRIVSQAGINGTRLRFAGTVIGASTAGYFLTGANFMMDGVCIVNECYENATGAHPIIPIQPNGNGFDLRNGYLDGGTTTTWAISAISKAANAVVTTTRNHNLSQVQIRTVTGITQAASAVVTVSASHTIGVGTKVSLGNVAGMTQINGGGYYVTAVTATTLTLAVNSTGFSAYTSGGTISSSIDIAAVGGMTQIVGSWACISVTANTLTLAVNSTGFTTYTSGGTVDGGYRDRVCLGISLDTTLAIEDLELNTFDVFGVSYGIFKSNNNRFTKNRLRCINSKFHDNFYEDFSPNAPNGVMTDVRLDGCEFYAGQTHKLFTEAPSNGHLAISGASVRRFKITNNSIKVDDYSGHFTQGIHLEEWCDDFVIANNSIEFTGVTGTIGIGIAALSNNIGTFTINAATQAANCVITTTETHNYVAGNVLNIASAVGLAGASATVTGITQAGLAVVTTSAAHTVPVGAKAAFSGVSGMTQVNGNSYTVLAVTSTTMTLQVDSSGFSAYVSGGTVTHGLNGAWSVVSVTATTATLSLNSSAYGAYTSGGTITCLRSPSGTITGNSVTRIGINGGEGINILESAQGCKEVHVLDNRISGGFNTGLVLGGTYIYSTTETISFNSARGNTVKGAVKGIKVPDNGSDVRGNKTIDCTTHLETSNAIARDHVFGGTGVYWDPVIGGMLMNPSGFTKGVDIVGAVTQNINIFNWSATHRAAGRFDIAVMGPYIATLQPGGQQRCRSEVYECLGATCTAKGTTAAAYEVSGGGSRITGVALSSTTGNLRVDVTTGQTTYGVNLVWKLDGSIFAPS